MSNRATGPPGIRPYPDEAMAGRPTTRKPTPFGAKLIALRDERGLTQTELARLAGIPQQRIAYFERRARSPSVEFVTVIAKALGVSVETLIPGTEPTAARRRKGRPSDFEERWERVKRLPRSAQQDIIETLDVAIERAERRANA